MEDPKWDQNLEPPKRDHEHPKGVAPGSYAAVCP